MQTHLFYGEGLSLRVGDEVEDFAAMRYGADKYFSVLQRPWDSSRLVSFECWRRCHRCSTRLLVRAEFVDGKFAGAQAIVPSREDIRGADLFHSDLDPRVFLPAVRKIHFHATAKQLWQMGLWDVIEGLDRGDLGLDDDE